MAIHEQAASAPPSRIEQDTARIREMVDHLQSIQRRIIGHARKLGYFQDVPEPSGGKVAPVSTTLLDAIGDLERAVDGVSGSLNVFD